MRETYVGRRAVGDDLAVAQAHVSGRAAKGGWG
jgi:hypothetical protein